MEQQNYNCVITAAVNPEQTFETIKQVSAWWTRNFEGSCRNIGDVFTVPFGETFGKFKVIEMIDKEKIVWLTIDCNLHFLKDKKEWKGTKLLWEISGDNNSTQISFTHVGLVPGIECFNDCTEGWNHYIGKSLLGLLTKGKGFPDDENYSAKYKQ